MNLLIDILIVAVVIWIVLVVVNAIRGEIHK